MMKRNLIALVLPILLLGIISNDTLAQSFQTHVPVNGIKVIIDQEKISADKVNIAAVKMNNTEVIQQQKNLQPVALENAGALKRQPALDQQLQERLKSSPAYVSTSKPASKNPELNSSKPNGVAFSAPNIFTKEFITNNFFTSEVRAILTKSLKDILLGEINAKLNQTKGFSNKDGYGTHSRSNFQLGNQFEVETEYFNHSTNPSLTLKVKIPANRLFVQMMTPYSTSNTDPNFWITFDLIATSSISIPTSTSQTNAIPQLGNLIINATNISKPQSNNILSKVIILVTDHIIPFFGGPNFINELRRNQNYIFPTNVLSNNLIKVRNAFSNLPVMRIENYADGKTLVLKATNKKEEEIYLR